MEQTPAAFHTGSTCGGTSKRARAAEKRAWARASRSWRFLAAARPQPLGSADL